MTPLVQLARPRRAAGPMVACTINGQPVEVEQGTTILAAAKTIGVRVPTLCLLETLTPVNACRLCVVEVKGARVLAPACARAVEACMEIATDSPRVHLTRKLVLEMLASSVDLSAAPDLVALLDEYGARPGRFGPKAPAAPAGARHAAIAGHHEPPDVRYAATVAEPPTVDNELYVRDYAKCVLCYKCVEACGTDHQNTFAIAVAGRGFDAHISTELAVPLPDSACVYCGNCIAVCPTGALVGRREYDLRAEGNWHPEAQSATDTICPYCGVGCTLTLHVQDGEIVKATSPMDNTITMGNLCLKGRFGWRFVQSTEGR
ncbi:MAG: (2Fe-2S)-binding protein [Gemmatimonadetes bacterium]|nr:(2Fe-2S)-binding protein [Gemmatimonadota bacterium]